MGIIARFLSLLSLSLSSSVTVFSLLHSSALTHCHPAAGGIDANRREGKESWEHSAYAPQGVPFLPCVSQHTASVCVSAAASIPLGGRRRLKRLEFGMSLQARFRAVLFGVLLLSVCGGELLSVEL